MSDKKDKKKKKKEKITYIDDGRSLADMSGTRPYLGPRDRGENKTTFKSAWATYWDAVKMMFVPMLITLGIITLVFLILYLFMR